MIKKVEVLQGTEKRLYDLVAPLVMDPAVLRQNNRVAFKTTPKHIWIVAVSEDGRCLGFLPIQTKGNRAEINNYYIQNRDLELFDDLIAEALRYAKRMGFTSLEIIAITEDSAILLRKGFVLDKSFVKYIRYKKGL
jgi:hypothetical protein